MSPSLLYSKYIQKLWEKNTCLWENLILEGLIIYCKDSKHLKLNALDIQCIVFIYNGKDARIFLTKFSKLILPSFFTEIAIYEYFMYFARFQFILDKRWQLLLIHRDREDGIYKVREIHYPIFCQVKYSSRNLDHFERYTETKLVEEHRIGMINPHGFSLTPFSTRVSINHSVQLFRKSASRPRCQKNIIVPDWFLQTNEKGKKKNRSIDHLSRRWIGLKLIFSLPVSSFSLFIEI